ncbi:MAG: choice-of-anchor B family protein [Chitinophagales bacterium]|nr:choice-of-anchor B family protein [Chitinophagales bacterium]
MKRTLIVSLLLTFTLLSQSNAQQNMSLLGTLPYSSDLSDIWGYADSAGNEYALVGVFNGLSIVDISEPGNPTELFFLNGPSSSWRDIKVYNNHAYVTNESSGGMRIVDLSNLPDTVTSVNYTGTVSVPFSSAHNVFIDENGYAYVVGANYGVGGAIILDLNPDPKAPVLEGVYNVRYIHDCYVRGDTMWSAEISDGIFSVVDVSNKSNPIVMATQSTPSNFTHNVWIGNNGSTLYTTDEVSGAFIGAYDVSNLGNITQTDVFQSSPGQGVIPHNVFVKNNFAIISYYRDGVVIVDVSKPNKLIQSGNYDTSPFSGAGFAGCWGVYPYLPSGNIIASDIEQGLFVLEPIYQRACFIEGNITDSITTAPLNNVLVEMSAVDISTTSDFTGQYADGTMDAGTYSATFSKTGYLSKTVSNITLSNGITTLLNVELAAATLFTLTGTVTEAGNGNPISNAKIAFRTGFDEFSATTDANGNYTIPNFPEGQYDGFAGKWGFQSGMISMTINPGAVINFTLDQGYKDDFVLDNSWTENSSASTGRWEIGIPIGTFLNSIPSNPDADVIDDLGDRCFITGNGGGAAGNDDVDNGTTTLNSPLADLSSYNDPYLGFNWWYFVGGGSTVSDDTLKFFLDNGISKVGIFSVPPNAPNFSMWNEKLLRVTDFLAPTNQMKLEVVASDLPGTGHVVEAAIDNVCFFDSASCKNPVPISNTVLNSNDVRLTWTSQTGAEKYEIRGKGVNDASFVNITVNNGAASTYVAKNLPGNRSYIWQIRTVCNAASSIVSTYTEFDTIDLFCNPPTSLSVTNLTPTSATLNWAPVANTFGYNILGKQSGSQQIVSINVSAGTTSYLATSLSPSTSYQWTVRQACEFNNSVFTYSDIAPVNSFTTPSSKNSLENPLSIYPNPTENWLYFSKAISNYEIYSIHNQLITSESNVNVNKLDMSAQQPGVYVIKVKQEDGTYRSFKVVSLGK